MAPLVEERHDVIVEVLASSDCGVLDLLHLGERDWQRREDGDSLCAEFELDVLVSIQSEETVLTVDWKWTNERAGGDGPLGGSVINMDDKVRADFDERRRAQLGRAFRSG